jgi:invasion protein IalB
MARLSLFPSNTDEPIAINCLRAYPVFMSSAVRFLSECVVWSVVLVFAAKSATAQALKQSRPARDDATYAATDAPVSADPQATSAAYGDWVYVCQRLGKPVKRVCEVTQAIQVQGQPGPIAQLAIGKTGEGAGLKLTVVLPSNVLLSTAPSLMPESKDLAHVDTEWVRCLPGGCFSEVALKDDVVKRWRGLSVRGKIDFRDGIGREVALPFSFKGLAQALDALAKD